MTPTAPMTAAATAAATSAATAGPASPMRRASGSQAVYAELHARVLDGRLAPGERLNESALSSALGVSRTPYREAVRLLMAEGLLEQLPTGGVVVTQVSARAIEELYGVRAVLEGLMCAEAAARATPSDISMLHALLERNTRLLDLPAEASEAGHQLHLAIARIAGNGWASRLHAQVDTQMARYRVFTNETPTRRAKALTEHRGIVEALERGDAALARARAEQHVHHARDTALGSIGSALP